MSRNMNAPLYAGQRVRILEDVFDRQGAGYDVSGDIAWVIEHDVDTDMCVVECSYGEQLRLKMPSSNVVPIEDQPKQTV